MSATHVRRPAHGAHSLQSLLNIAIAAAVGVVLVGGFAGLLLCRIGVICTPNNSADLTAIHAQVRYSPSAGDESILAPANTQQIAKGDRIGVDDIGEARLRFSDFLTVRIYRNSTIAIEGDVAQDAAPIYHYRLESGTTFNTLNPDSAAKHRVQVSTKWAQIEDLGTEFLAYVDPQTEVTWVVVRQGQANVTAAGKSVAVAAGKQTWVEPRKPPEPPIPASRPAIGMRFPLVDALTNGAMPDNAVLTSTTAVPTLTNTTAPTNPPTETPTISLTATLTQTPISPTGVPPDTPLPPPIDTPVTPTNTPVTPTDTPTDTPTPTLTDTPSPTITPTITPSPTITPTIVVPPPTLSLRGTEQYMVGEQAFTRYLLGVDNWADYPAEFFDPAPDLPPCGENTSSSRTHVDIYNARNNQYIYGFCALSSPQDLNSIWFAVPRGQNPPVWVYIVLTDRRTGQVNRSNDVRIPAEPPADTPTIDVPQPILSLHGTETYVVGDQAFTRYLLGVDNWANFPGELFAPAPDLPPCGLNANSSRTWLDIYSAGDNQYIYGFCALSSPQDLNSIWFAVPQGQQPPAAVYITLNDRRTGQTYRSNDVDIPAEIVVNATTPK